ncbi:hypothetical protein F4777DRAFT_564530 [Nemania sp. FL0916]|nr:hypothetical protein F4777DRAFT_564530 [Nemania sp. FL0916]
MQTPAHLRIFPSPGPRQAESESLDTFPLFRKLPPELRQKIWRIALLRERLTKFRLLPRIGIDDMVRNRGDDITRLEQLENEVYGVLDENVPALSSVFHVNRESRDVALSHYRVHLPCWRIIRPKTPREILRRVIFYLNPEYDFLRINADFGHVADFIHDLKETYDPRHRGVLNLVVHPGLLQGPAGLVSMNPASLDNPQRTSFMETIRQLDEIFFLHEQVPGRVNIGVYSAPSTLDYRLNRALPAHASTTGFTRLGPDPRPIRDHLENVFIGEDPCDTVNLWNGYINQHFRSLGMPKTRSSILMTTLWHFDDVRNRRMAEEALQKEEDAWLNETSKRWPPAKAIVEGLEHSNVSTAFGFWLLPVNAFDDLPRRGAEFLDLREKWPQLVLSNLDENRCRSYGG